MVAFDVPAGGDCTATSVAGNSGSAHHQQDSLISAHVECRSPVTERSKPCRHSDLLEVLSPADDRREALTQLVRSCEQHEIPRPSELYCAVP
jgi:hypothetical protein